MASITDMDYQAALKFLFGRINYERTANVPYRSSQFKLQRMRDLLAQLGDPHRQLRAIHVAGTKGKGSTASMLASVLTAAGYRTGLYTSPHLSRLEERANVDGQRCSEVEVAELIGMIRPVIERMDEVAAAQGARGPTFFEITTAMVMLHFVRHKVDLAVLEVGLGGRLDSTNVCLPEVCAITSISYDHTKLLGNTLAEISAEKAGIIKPAIPVVSGVTQLEPRDVIRRRAEELGCELAELDRDFCFDYQPQGKSAAAESPRCVSVLHYRELTGDRRAYANVSLPLLGKHQAANASVALAAIGKLRNRGWNVPDEAIIDGLASTRCPGRVEVVSRRPTIVVDAAHNVASSEALVQTLDESFTADRRVLLFATSTDKHVEGILRCLLPRFDEVIVTRYSHNPRFVEPVKLAGVAARIQPTVAITVCENVESAWRGLRAKLAITDLGCVAGSSFLAGEIRSLAEQTPPLEVAGQQSP